MPASSASARSALKTLCLILLPLLAACGGGGGDGGGSVAASCGPAKTLRTPPAPRPGEPPAGITLGLLEIGTFSAPLFVTAPPGDTNRIFVVEKGGTIRVVDRNSNGVIGTFLNISSLIDTDGEGGLHGLAFDPDYANNGRFYVSYSSVAGSTVLARYLVSGNPNVAQQSSGQVLLTIE